MPVYEYQCENCNKVFEIIASIKEKDKGLEVSCPECKSLKVFQIFRKINIVTSSKVESDDFGPDLDKIPEPEETGGEEAMPDLGEPGGEDLTDLEDSEEI